MKQSINKLKNITMKIKQLFLAAMTMLAFGACTFIPESPYNFPSSGGGENGGTNSDYYINETFATSFGVFSTVETVGNYPWVIDYSTAKATSYDSNTQANNPATSWLISDAVDFTNETEAYVAFEYIIRYSETGKVANNHQLLISANYSGDAAAATWVDLPYNAVEGADWNTFYKANVTIPAEFLGKSGVVFALRYTATTKASTWEVKNFKVAHGTAAEPEEPEEASEYTVAEALAAFTGVAKPAIVKGYIVGSIDDKSIDDANFSGNAVLRTNLLIADNADEKDITKCLAVQLPSGAVRNALNLVDNPGNYKKQVVLTGSLEKYFGVAGLKNVTKYEIEGSSTEEPETPDTPETPEVPTGNNLLTNGSFEDWSGSKPAYWATLSTSNATISQSNDARTGNYAVVVGGATSNKRFASQSYTLQPGTYTFSAYVKTNGSEAGHCRLGYVTITNGVAGTYTYESAAASAVSSEWTARVFEFTLTEETELAFIVMNNKTGNGASFLVDDAALTTANGSIGNGSEDNEEPEAPAAGEYLNATFYDSFGSFTTKEVVGNFGWSIDASYHHAKVSGYANGASQDAESWLISPAMNLTGETAANITFDYVINKGDANAAAANHKLLITSNYTGDVTTTTWTEISYGAVNNNNWTFNSTGAIALPQSMMNKGAVVIAFKYMSSTANSSTWEVKNVVVSSATK